MRELAKDREFLAYVGARQTAEFAYTIETVAVGWQIYGLRHQPLDLGLVGLVLFIPQLVLAIPAGVLADRFDRRTICILCTLGEALAELAFLGIVLTGSRSLALNLGVVAVIGTAHSLGTPALRSLLAGIVHPERFTRAQAMSTSLGEVVAIGGPTVGGILIAIGLPFAFAAAAALYAVGAVAFLLLKSTTPEKQASRPGAWIEGIRFITTQPVVLGAISLDLFAVLFGGATVLLPVYATHILNVGPIGFGLLRSAPGVGAIAVAAFLARHPIRRRAGPVLMWCVAGFGVATIVFALSRNLVLSLVALAATGGFDVVSVVIRSTLVQLGTPNALRGRVSAVENVFIGASNELGAFESGAVAALIGTVASVALGGVATLVVIGLWAVLFPSLRRYDRIVSVAENA